MLSLILSDISTARQLGARHIQFTVTADELEQLEAEFNEQSPEPRYMATDKDRKAHPDAKLWVIGCPIYLGTAYSYSWK